MTLEVLEERVRAMQEALKLQAFEVERRLNELNHAHEKQVQYQSETVPREVFGNFKDEVNTKLNTLAGKSSGVGATWALLFQLVTLGISVTAIILTLLK